MSMNCSTPVDYWLSMPLRHLSKWIHTNNEIKRRAQESIEET